MSAAPDLRPPAAAPAPTFFEMTGVAKSFGRTDADGGKRTEVLSGVNLDLREGEFLAIVGFSGSGKTTLISLMAGLLEPDQGVLRMEGRPIHGPGPDRGVVFQNYSLLPWLTVTQNVRLAVDQVFGKETAAERRGRVDRYVEMVNLKAAATKRPHELSGGMRQRVAVARALAMEPRMLLMDEPLSALDALTRGSLQIEIERIWARDRRTVVLITNSVDEAVLLADRIVPLKPGPRASLGPSFEVDLTRPRDRRGLNRSSAFQKVRNDVTRYLIEMQSRNAPPTTSGGRTLPDLEPIDLRAPRMRFAR